jgi:hypothetical protein
MTQAARDDLRAREDEVADLRAQLLAVQSSLGEPLKVAEGFAHVRNRDGNGFCVQLQI